MLNDEISLTIDICNAGDYLDVQKRPRPASESPSSIIFSSLVYENSENCVNGCTAKLVVKAFLDPDGFTPTEKKTHSRLYNSLRGLKYEALVYKNVISNIISRGYSANFVRFVGYGECTVGELRHTLQQPIERANFKVEDHTRACALITKSAETIDMKHGHSGSTPLFEFLTSSSTRDKIPDITLIILQLLYTLQVMRDLGIKHNDMHAGNILIEDVSASPRVIALVYGQLPEQTFVFQTNYIPLIFDWDMSSVQSLGRNEKLSRLKSLNITNDPDDTFDLFTLCCQLCEYSEGNLGDFYDLIKHVKFEDLQGFECRPQFSNLKSADLPTLDELITSKVFMQFNLTITISSEPKFVYVRPIFDRALVLNELDTQSSFPHLLSEVKLGEIHSSVSTKSKSRIPLISPEKKLEIFIVRMLTVVGDHVKQKYADHFVKAVARYEKLIQEENPDAQQDIINDLMYLSDNMMMSDKTCQILIKVVNEYFDDTQPTVLQF